MSRKQNTGAQCKDTDIIALIKKNIEWLNHVQKKRGGKVAVRKCRGNKTWGRPQIRWKDLRKPGISTRRPEEIWFHYGSS